MHKKCDRCKLWLKKYGKDVSCDSCPDGTYKNELRIHAIDTVNLRNYKVNNGNVSKARVDMIKSRVLHPDGSGEVVLRNRSGKPTNRRASEV